MKDTLGFADKPIDSVVLKNVMKNSGITVQTIDLTYGSLIDKENMNDIKLLKEQIGRTFSVSMEAREKTCCSGVKVQYNGERRFSSFATLNLKLVGRQNNDPESNDLSAYLILKLSVNKQGQELIGQYNHYLQKNLKVLGLDPKINTSIRGMINKKMTHDEQYAFLQAMFQELNGKVTEGLNEKKVISLSGYSEDLNRFVMSKNKRINVQIASRYNPLNKQTVITIGNPIVTMTY